MFRCESFLLVGIAAAVLAPVVTAAEEAKPKAGTIQGKVVGPDGKPLAGVVVKVHDQFVKPLPGKPSQLPGPVAEVKTGKDGKFRATGVRTGTFWIGFAQPTKARGIFLVGGVKPFKLAAGKVHDVGTIKSQRKDLRPSFLRDIEEGRSNR
jgi:hypothetical protein